MVANPSIAPRVRWCAVLPTVHAPKGQRLDESYVVFSSLTVRSVWQYQYSDASEAKYYLLRRVTKGTFWSERAKYYFLRPLTKARLI